MRRNNLSEKYKENKEREERRFNFIYRCTILIVVLGSSIYLGFWVLVFWALIKFITTTN